MEITYLGHASFKIKAKTGTLITDPYGNIGKMKYPAASADVITVSHQHPDHNNIKAISGTARRKDPFIIAEPGEFEVEGVSVFGYPTYHDNKEGAERGANIIYVIQSEDIRILHLGDLGHTLTDKMIDDLGTIDVVMVPVGGFYTIDAKTAVSILNDIEPTYVLPMHYRTPEHDPDTFGKVDTIDTFLAAYEHTNRKVKSLQLTRLSIPTDLTEVILFE